MGKEDWMHRFGIYCFLNAAEAMAFPGGPPGKSLRRTRTRELQGQCELLGDPFLLVEDETCSVYISHVLNIITMMDGVICTCVL